MPRLNLSQRFALLIFTLGLLLVIPLVGLQTYNARFALQQRIQVSSEVIADALDSLSRAHLKDHEVSQLRSELRLIVTNNRLAYIDVFSANGQPLINLVHPEHGRGSTRESMVQNVQDNVLDLTRTLGSADHPLGRLEVGIWVKGIEHDTAQIARNGILMGLALCITLAFVSWGLGRWLARRLRNFADNLAALTPLDYQHLDFHGSDEVGAVVQSFNELQDRLKEAQGRRDRAERERQDMTRMIVHDLKGPLGAFLGGLNMLEDSVQASGDPEQIQVLQLMKRSTDRLLRMTQSILQLDRLEDMSQQIKRIPVDVEALALRRVEEARPLAQDLQVSLDLSRNSREIPPVPADPDLLGRVIDNLMFNALEHTPHGGRVHVSIQSEDGVVEISVRDTGPGIPPEERERIFEKFRKGPQASNGVGLGLAFSKRVVERHGGQIGVKDAPGGGALFYFTLPVERRAVTSNRTG